MLEAFCKDKLAPLLLRLAFGLIGIYHGYLKIMANGGMTWSPGLGVGWQLAIAWGEFAAGLAILAGFHTRIAAALLVGLSAGTLAWFRGWTLLQSPLPSLEAPFLLLLLGMSLVCLGSGELSVDARSGGALAGKSAVRKKRDSVRV